MTLTVETAYVAILTAILAGIITWVKALSRKVKATHGGIMCLLYKQIKDIHVRCIDLGYCSLELLEDAEMYYKEYKAFDSNGVCKSAMEDLRRMQRYKGGG